MAPLRDAPVVELDGRLPDVVEFDDAKLKSVEVLVASDEISDASLVEEEVLKKLLIKLNWNQRFLKSQSEVR